MAFGGRELRLILSIQSYGTGNIQRLRRDIASLGTATDIANKQQLLQARLAKQGLRVSAAQQDLKSVRAGVPFYTARAKAQAQWSRANASVLSTQARQMNINRQLFDVETKRQALSRKIGAAKVAAMPVADIKILERGLQSLDMQESALTLSTKALKSQLADQAKVVATLTAEMDDLVAITGAQSVASKEAIATVDAETASYKMLQAEIERTNLAQRMQRAQRAEVMARTVSHVGRTAQFAGLIGLAGVSVAASSFANFNKQLTLAATQARDINAPLSQVVTRTSELEHGFDKAGQHFEGILELMQQFPASGDEMAKAAYDIYSSMQVSFGQGLDLLKAFNQLAVATGSDLATATSAGITVLNNFGKTTHGVNDTLNLMVATVRFGRMRLEEFNAMLSKIAPAAVAAGQSFKDVAGAMALLTTRQPSQQISATGIARLLQTFRDPDFQKGAFRFGADLTKGAGAVGALKPLPKIIEEMNKHFGLAIKQGGASNLFKQLTAVGHESGVGRQSRIEAANAYVLLIKNIQDYRSLQKAVTGDTSEFSKALAAMSASPGVRWSIFINQMKAFVLTIGEAALPALLKMAGYLQRAAHWFEALSKHTKDTVVQLIAFGSAGLIVGGTLLNIAGSLAALAANMRLASGESTVLTKGLTGLMGIGIIAIPIVLQLLRGGDPGMWDFLGAALAGAAGGAAIGSLFPGPGTLIGAGIGAIAVPITIDLISHFQGSKDPTDAAHKAYAKYAKAWQDQFESGGKITNKLMSFGDWLKANPKWVASLKKRNLTQKELAAQYQKRLKEFNTETLKNMLGGNKALQDAYSKLGDSQNQASKDAAQLAKAHANAVQTAMASMKDKIKTGVDNIAAIYENFKQINEQGIGEIFGGPTMQGFLGQIFGNLNDQLRQFGIQIAVPFSILKQDQDQSFAYFKRWRGGLDKLMKRKVPLDMIQSIEKLGPTAIPMIEGLLGANPKQLNKYIKQYKTMQDAVKKTAAAETRKQLKEWEKYGNDAAYKMVMGLNSGLDANELGLQKKFKSFFVDTFGGVLKKQMQKEVALAMKNARQDIAAAATGMPKPGTAPGPGAGPGGRGPGGLTQKQVADRLQVLARQERAIRRAQRRLTPAPAFPGAPALPSPPLSPAQQRRLRDIHRQQRTLRRMERRSIRRQMAAHEGEFNYNITYGGDTVHIHADGATVNSVERALRKRHFQKMNKHH